MTSEQNLQQNLRPSLAPIEQSGNQAMFKQMIHGFEAIGMPYCLLAGYDGFPEHIPSDIDFMVSPQSNAQLPALIASIAQASGTQLVQHLQHETTASYFVLAKLKDAHITYLHPDSSSDYRRNGKRWLLAETVLENRRRHPHGFWIPSTADAFSYYLIKKLDKGHLNATQAIELTNRYHEDTTSCKERLYQLLPNNEAGLLETALISRQLFEGTEWRTVDDNLAIIKKAMHAKSQNITWRERLFDSLAEVQRLWLRLREPTGLRIAFLGPDGSGKSTIISAVTKQLSQSFRHVEYRHLRPGRLPKNSNTEPVTNPHAKPVRSKIGSHLKLLYFWSQYLFGNVLWLYPRYVCSTLVIFDRYFHDLLADPLRYRYGGSLNIARQLGRTLTQPDLVFILDAPAEVLQSRKQEVSLAESARQREAYQSLVKEFNNAHIINTNQPVEQVINDVLLQVLNFLESRTHQRLHLSAPNKGINLCKP
jgi:thymidylate kinase